MKVLELFAGTRSIGKVFEKAGHEVYSIEWDRAHPDIDWYTDISQVSAEAILERFGQPDIIWASPDCTSYSVAGISHHRRKDQVTGRLLPISKYAVFCDVVNRHVVELIKELQPKFYFIENPRGGMRKMDFVEGLPRYTVTYCQYGDTRMKPTDIWTNHPAPGFHPICKNGDPCHESAPRSATVRKMKEQGIELKIGGTQYGMDNSKDRSRIPALLCEHIVTISEASGMYGSFNGVYL